MAEEIGIGARVQLTEKGGVTGKVGFFGPTQFNASGKWVGVILDSPEGKVAGGKSLFGEEEDLENNGTVQGVSYFQCEANHGIFVRPGQITLMDGGGGDAKAAGLRTPAPSGLKKPSAGKEAESGGVSRIKAPGKSKLGVSPSPSVERLKSASQSSLRSSPSSEKLSPKGSPTKEKSSPPPKTEAKSKLGKPVSAKEMAASPPPSDPPTPKGESVAQKVAQIKKESAERKSSGGGIVLSSGEQMSEGAELEYLRSESRDLSEKLETLRSKRAEDKQKLLDYERCKIQLQQLLEFKQQMTASHSEVLRQLTETKAELKAAISTKDSILDESSGANEAVEMATLDKEMAEEKAEILQQELDSYKERVQELEMDLEIVRAEIDEHAEGGAPASKGGETTNVQVKQLTTQNERLKEALVKMRDLSAHNSDENGRLSKENEAMKLQVADMSRKVEAMTAECSKVTETMADLQEQVDAALGSEKMVEELAEKNMELEEKIKELQELNDDLESMRLMDDEMAENQKEVERDLRQDLDLAGARYNQLNLDLKDANKRCDDLELTIKKFRQKVAEQQEQMEDYKDQIRIAEEDLNKTEEDIMGLESTLSNGNPEGTKQRSGSVAASGRLLVESVEGELRLVELESVQAQVKYLRSFLPDNFTKAGGDGDAVNLSLLFPRLEAKAQLLARLIMEKYPRQLEMRREHVSKSHKGEQWSFAARFHYHLSVLTTTLNRFQGVMERCSVERLERLATLWPEATVQERNLDLYFGLLKSNRLDENTSIDSLLKVINYFQNIYTVHVPKEEYNGNKLVTNTARQLLSGTYWLRTDVMRLRFYLLGGQETSDVGREMAELEMYVGEAESLCVRMKKRVPDSKSALVSLPPEVADEAFGECRGNLEKAANILHTACSIAATQVSMLPDVEGLDAARLTELLQEGCEKVAGKYEEKSPNELIRACLGGLMRPLAKAAEAMEAGTWSKPPPDSSPFPPVLERAHLRKQAAVDAEGLRWQMEKKEGELMEAKKAIRLKSDEISEMRIRIDMAEKKATQTHSAGTERLTEFESKIRDLEEDLKKQKREHEQALDAQLADIEALEKVNTELKDKNTLLSKKALLQGMTHQAGLSAVSPSSPSHQPWVQTPPLPGNVENPILLSQIESLKSALQASTLQCARLKGAEMSKTLRSMKPLNVPKNPAWLRRLTNTHTAEEHPERPDRRDELVRMGREVERFTKAYVEHVGSQRLPDVSGKGDPYGELRERAMRERELKWWLEELKGRLAGLRGSQLPGAGAVSTFGAFPSPDFHPEGRSVATLTLPALPTERPTPVILTPDQFRRFHASIIE